MASANSPHVLIIGAGITGLALGQALRQNGIPFTIFERDPTPDYRGKGWGLSLHWSLDMFLSWLPHNLADRLPESYVNPDAMAEGDLGQFQIFDLKTGKVKFVVPPSRRIRVARERLRRLLMEGLDIQWNKCLSDISESSATSICAHFTDNSSAIGTQVLGCDGIRSRMRMILCTSPRLPPGIKTSYENYKLPIRLMGVNVPFKPHLADKFIKIDKYFLQGTDPDTNFSLWFSFLDTPSNNTREDQDSYDCQIMIGWPYRREFLGREEPLDIPLDNIDRLKMMKFFSRDWAEPFGEIVQHIPDDTVVKVVSLEDFQPPMKGLWDNIHGKATLIGDAAHGMTMFRGEGGNHGLYDVGSFMQSFIPALKPVQNGGAVKTLQEACDEYEQEMITRTRPAVIRSRQASLDAHDYASLSEESPLISKRAPYFACDQVSPPSRDAQGGHPVNGSSPGVFTRGEKLSRL
ncbi:hypothetical protein AJ80_01096 [Polytolypa hystricis UAMH7299]|uniref:FAD-binding domain-containing protein n=1 Tax=Polytolypa hystricis (strain UAMH7299) TaxID=1447883 RepID=A0A2B7Z158_POLH7|nr:hypothetical protein AJ80_01096 [Polytolypa hystricis UAMH7299]